MENPIEKFKSWWETALVNTPLNQKNAVCVSTINENGFPSERFVDLKAVSDDGFTFCTYLDSQKGGDIRKNNKVSLTFWWEHVGYQVRVTGLASEIAEVEAQYYWDQRTKDAQITTSCCKQSQPLNSESDLMKQFLQTKEKFAESSVGKPDNWGGYLVTPVSIEFLTFKENRLHFRELFKNTNNVWCKTLLQP